MLGARRAFLRACVVVQVTLGTWGAVAWAGAVAPPPLRWPLEGEVVAGYTAADRYGPGHRGLDIESGAGSPVRAAHDGRVAFAGSVAGVQSVTVQHQTEWKTSYSFLGTIAVAEGAEVRRGAVLGTAGRLHGTRRYGVHFSLRRGDEYADPIPFMIGSRPLLLPPPSDTGGAALDAGEASSKSGMPEGCSVWLVDCSGPLGAALERGSSLVATVLERGASLGRAFMQEAAIVADWAARAEQAAARALRLAISDASEELAAAVAGLAAIPLRTSSQAALMFEPVGPEFARRIRRKGRRLASHLESTAREEVRRLLDEALEPAAVAAALREEAAALARYETERALRSQSCLTESELNKATPASRPDGVLYVVVSGLGSSFEPEGSRPDLVEALQMRGKEVVRFSYRGFEKKGSGEIDPLPYLPEDTYKDIRVSARLLADQLAALGRANPGKKIVVVAHSQGGVVARYALQNVYPQGSDGYPEIAALVTIASPHRGSGGAADLLRASKSETGRGAVLALGGSAGSIVDAESLRQLAWGSEFMRELGTRAPKGIPTTSIAASTDMVVPAPETLLDGASNTIVDAGADGLHAHSKITENPRALMALEAAVRGRSLCQSREEVTRAASVAAITTVGVERTRDALADSLEATG